MIRWSWATLSPSDQIVVRGEPSCRPVGGLPANIDLHDLVERDAVLAPIVELGGAGRRMRRHLTRLLECATVLEVGRNASAAEGVVADLRCDAGRLCATAHHSPCIVSVEPLTIELRLPTTIRATFDGLEQGDPSGVRELGTLKVFGEVALQRVVAGHFVVTCRLFRGVAPTAAAAGGRGPPRSYRRP